MSMAFVFLFAVNILTNFGNTGFDQAFNYYLKDALGLTSSYNGIVKALVGLISFAANMTLCIWIINRTKVRRSLVVIVLVCTCPPWELRYFPTLYCLSPSAFWCTPDTL